MGTLLQFVQGRTGSAFLALLFLLLILALSVILEGCTERCEMTRTYTYYEPVYTPLAEVRSAVGVFAPQPLSHPGKIYYKDGYLFVNESGKGIHVIDDRDPANPVSLSFVNIPGNFELAAMNNTLYADSYVDLVMFDISNPAQVVPAGKVENFFQYYSVMNLSPDPQQGVITDWTERQDVQVNESDCDMGVFWEPWGGAWYRGGMLYMADAQVASPAMMGNGSAGIGGSMARFTISHNYLYTLDAGSLYTTDIADERNPVKQDTLYLSWDVETIFPHESNLFLGSRSGMHILDISNPSTPVQVASYGHMRSCDPVVVQGQYAYVTLRSGTACEGFANQLDIIDLSSITDPQLLKTYPMHNPHGLGIDGDVLFICDGDDGLKVYNATDVNAIQLLAHYKSIHAFDVIPFEHVAMLIGEDGLYQYDYANASHITQLSYIPFVAAE